MFILSKDACGLEIDPIVPGTISTFVTIMKIVIPIILIIFGIIDFSKAVMANEEKEMKEAQKRFIKRIIYAIIVFFVVALVQFVFSRLGAADTSGNNVAKSNISGCIDWFINGK